MRCGGSRRYATPAPVPRGPALRKRRKPFDKLINAADVIAGGNRPGLGADIVKDLIELGLSQFMELDAEIHPLLGFRQCVAVFAFETSSGIIERSGLGRFDLQLRVTARDIIVDPALKTIFEVFEHAQASVNNLVTVVVTARFELALNELLIVVR